jgi:hypothetical protein
MKNGNAIAIVRAARDRGSLVFANIENMEANVDLYRTEVTELSFTASDFHTISGKLMPNKAAVDRIGEASGIQFIQAACRVTAETRDDSQCGKRTVFRGEAQGKIRMPDGSWRTSTVDEYEFDPVLRAMLDKNVIELNEQTKQTIGRTVLEYTKVARQRAATGARLRVIRQLTGMPGAFEKADAAKPFVFTRVVQNTSYILGTPEGRAMATAQALGVDVASLFGKKALAQSEAATPETENVAEHVIIKPESEDSARTLADEASNQQGDTIPDFDVPPNQAASHARSFESLADDIRDFLEAYSAELNVTTKSGSNPYKSAETELSNPNATVETRKDMIERLRSYLAAKGVRT